MEVIKKVITWDTTMYKIINTENKDSYKIDDLKYVDEVKELLDKGMTLKWSNHNGDIYTKILNNIEYLVFINRE